MNATAQEQFRALGDAHAIRPDELPIFECMSETGRAYFTRTRLAQRLRENGLPSFIGPPKDWRACADLVKGYTENAPANERQLMRECGVPLRGDDAPSVPAQTRTGRVTEMWGRITEAGALDESWRCLNEAQVPLKRRGPRPDRPALSPSDALRAAGVALLSEASAASSTGGLDRPAHEVVAGHTGSVARSALG